VGSSISREGVATNAEVILRTANSIYNGNDGFKIGYTTSSTVTDDFSDGLIQHFRGYIPQISNTGLLWRKRLLWINRIFPRDKIL
jgi:hypothetical protein